MKIHLIPISLALVLAAGTTLAYEHPSRPSGIITLDVNPQHRGDWRDWREDRIREQRHLDRIRQEQERIREQREREEYWRERERERDHRPIIRR